MERPTLSQSWNRVAKLAPTLRPRVEIRRQLYRGEPWYVVHDIVSNSFFRLNPVAYHFVGLLDGKRTVDEVWNLTLERYGDEAPTQDEVIALLGQLNSSNLLRVDLPADAEQLLERNRKRKFKQWGGQAMNILFVRIPIFNPEPMLRWITPLFKPIINRWGFLLWLIVITVGLVKFLPHLGEFLASTESMLAPKHWPLMIVLFIITKAIHELGHGIVCKAFGGEVPVIGVMLLVLFPAPYVDATASWNFPDKWKRLSVAGAGMMFELFIAAIAMMFWPALEAGTLAEQLCYHTIFLASVTTILFNANPLIRFDGYYMLSDLLEIPNMYERAKKQMYYIVQRYAYGVKHVPPVSTYRGEQFWLFLYSIASTVYRVLLLTGIILFIMGQLFTIGLILAIWSIIAWLCVPIGKFFHWLFTSPTLMRQRNRALWVTFTFLAIVFLAIGAIPAEEHRYTEGVVESDTRTDVSVYTDGFVEEVLVEAGQRVTRGQPMLICDNPELRARKQELLAELRRLSAVSTGALTEDHVKYQVTAEQTAAIQDALAEVNSRIERLVVRAPQSGTIVVSDLNPLLGQYLKRGDVVARIADLDALRVTALVNQDQNSLMLREGIKRVELRMAGNVPRVLEVHQTDKIKWFAAGTTRLPHPSMSQAGGGTIPVDPQDQSGQQAKHPYFEAWIPLSLVTLRSNPPDAVQIGSAAASDVRVVQASNMDSALAQADMPAEPQSSTSTPTPDATGLAGADPMTVPNAMQPGVEHLGFLAYPGQRVYVRFTLAEERPLMQQWLHLARQLILERLVL